MTYTAKFLEQTGDTCSYRIEERNEGTLIRAFTGKVPCTQRATAKGWNEYSDERMVERWCELSQAKLPKDGGTVDMDLSYVAKE
jgi:hypothetical protein